MTNTTDPFRKFFDDLGHRLDLHPTVAPVGQAWPILETHALYNEWLRFNQQHRELRIREEQVKSLQAEIQRLRTWIGDECPACGEDWHLDASGTTWSSTAEDQTQYPAVRNEVPRCYVTAARYLRAWAVLVVAPLAVWRVCQFHTANDLIGIPIALAVAALAGWFHRTMHRLQGGSQ